MNSPYTEEYLETLDKAALLDICKVIANRYRCNLETLVPPNSRKDVLIDTILESQEEAGGND